MIKSTMVAAALGFALAAMPAAADDLNVTQAGVYDYVNVTYSGALSGSTVAGNLRLGGVDSTGSIDFDAFCVDLAHTITVGFGSMMSTNYHYDYAPLTVDGFGNALSARQIQQMTGLASLGFSLARNPANIADVSAIQIAIWSVEHSDVTFTTSDSGINALVSHYLGLAPTLTGNARYIVSLDNPQRQGLLVPGVPEPATWGLLISGFGLVGLSVRRRRSQLANIAA